jgi:hypothetical protein
MTDPLFGSIWGSQGIIHIRDDRNASPEDPRINVELEGPVADLNLVQLSRLIATLKQAQDTMTARKEKALLNSTLPLF